jgi:hypothetical protein
MTRAKISEYSATANDNTDVNGTNIAEGCPPSSMNNMGREIMAALKRFQVGSDGDGVTVGGALVVSGATTANTFSATAVNATGTVTFSGSVILSGTTTANTFSTDLITEKTSAAGVTIDGVLLKDNGVVTGAGTVSAPVYSTTGDTNTGIFFPDADTIAFAEGGAEAMRIDSSGNVGIGTTSPLATNSGLDISSGGLSLVVGANNTSSARTNATNKISRIASAHYTNAEEPVMLAFTENTSTTNEITFGGGSGITNAATSIAFRTAANNTTTSGTERMRITAAGAVTIGSTTAISDVVGNLQLSGSGVGTTSGAGVLALVRSETDGVTNGDNLGSILFYGVDTTGNTPTQLAFIRGQASGTHAAGDNPTDLLFGVTADNTETVYEALRIRQNGTLDSQDTYDNTQSGSTVVVTSAGLIGRTSSSIKYKKDVETLDADLVANAITNLRPVWYRTKDAKGDDKETWSHIGLIAEEVHEVEPRLVRYRTEKVEFVDVGEQVTKTREVSPAVTDEDGNFVQEAVTEEYTETITRKEKRKTPLETPEPEDVDYGRLAVLCLAKIQQQEQTIAALEARLSALEAK